MISVGCGSTGIASVSPPFAANEVPTSGNNYAFANKQGNFAGFDVYITQTGSFYVYNRTIIGPSGTAEVFDQDVDFFFKVIPFTNRGVRNLVGPWELRFLTAGDVTPPPDVTNYSVQYVGGTAIHTWSKSTDVAVDHYEIREGPTWETSRLIVETPGSRTFETTAVIPGLQNFLIKAVDRAGNKSVNAIEFLVSLFTDEARRQFMVRDELDVLTGTFSDMAVAFVGSVTNYLRWSTSMAAQT